MDTRSLFIGTAAWAVPKALKNVFSSEGSQLERYSQILNCVEINTAFYRDHKPETYEKWARVTPANFRFAVKLSRVFTHEDYLAVDASALRTVVEGIMKLGAKLGVILVQLPPKMAFHEKTARTFFKQLRAIYPGALVIEPRHRTWVTTEALQVLNDFQVGKVIADPEPCASGEEFQKASKELCYVRWHGSPVIYESRYNVEQLVALKARLETYAGDYRSVWVIFDNTTFGWATQNALEMTDLIKGRHHHTADHPSAEARDNSLSI